MLPDLFKHRFRSWSIGEILVNVLLLLKEKKNRLNKGT